MSCMGQCLDMGPPPDSILFMPPPPVPIFFRNDFFQLNTTASCSVAQLCETSPSSVSTSLNQAPESGDYIELPRKDVEWSGIGDTWLLVLVASSIGVLILGALLAMFLLKCREMNMFNSSDCSLHQQMKHHEPPDCSAVTNMNGSKLVHPTETVLYHGSHSINDNRMVWATLTPRGTQHFVAENYPPDFFDYGENDDHYETVDNIVSVTPSRSYCSKGLKFDLSKENSSFDNSGFVDYDYEEPPPLIESYQHPMDDMNSPQYQMIGNIDMRCASLNTMRRSLALSRPRVSSPTRIEHPNLPPLNLYPRKGNTLKKNGTYSYRAVDGNTLPKYGL